MEKKDRTEEKMGEKTNRRKFPRAESKHDMRSKNINKQETNKQKTPRGSLIKLVYYSAPTMGMVPRTSCLETRRREE